MKKIICHLLIAALFVFCFTACGKAVQKDSSGTVSLQEASSEESGVTEEPADQKTELLTGKHHAEIEIEKYGTIKLELDADTAPITVTNFVNLAKSGFYDGLTFHRVASGFMIQGGDPNGDGTGGSDQTIKGEFTQNGVENNISHKRGVISMARAQDYDSASSQFFIMHEDSDFLDGQYAAFGEVTEGIEIVDKICEETPVAEDNETVLAGKQPKIKTVKVVD